MEMNEYLKFDFKIFNRAAVKISNEKDVSQIVFADFYPSFNIFGFHNSIILGAKGGLVLKFNINKQAEGAYQRKQITKFVNQPVISQKDPEFKDDVLKADPKKGVQVPNPHVFREFFESHEAEIMYIAFSESSDVFLTLDKTGKILIWNYDSKFIRPDGTFQPKSRFKINLETMIYEEAGTRDQIFPPKKKLKGAELTAAQQREVTEYEQVVMSNAFKFRTLDVTKIKDMQEYLVYKSKLPKDKEIEAFQFYTVDENNKKVKAITEQSFKASNKEGFIGHVEGSCNNRFLVIQLVLPHKLRPQSSTVVFLGYKVLTNSLKKLKITVETPKTDRGIEFKVQDNFDPLGSSYIYLLLRDGLYIFSLATGLIVKIIKPLNTGLKNVFFDQLAIFQHTKVFFASSAVANIWRFTLQDTNTQQAKEEALNERFEFLRLFNL